MDETADMPKIPQGELIARMARASERSERVRQAREATPPLATGGEVRGVQGAPPSKAQRAELPEVRIPQGMRKVLGNLPIAQENSSSSFSLWHFLMGLGLGGLALALAFWGYRTFFPLTLTLSSNIPASLAASL